MDSDDDICVLNHPPADDGDDDVEDCPPPILAFTPFSPIASPASGLTVDTGSHHALQKAYTEVKRRLNESDAWNRQLSRRVHELETNAKLNGSIGDSYDMMDDASYTSQGAVSQRPPPGGQPLIQPMGQPLVQLSGQAMEQPLMGQQMVSEAQLAAEEGFQNNLQRQLARAKAWEKKYQDYITESEHKYAAMNQQLQATQAQLAQLSKDKVTLQQSYENVKRERDTAQQSLADLKKKYETLEIEKDKATKETAGLITALHKANHEAAMLKERQGDSLGRDPPPELVAELAYMRKVIDSLKSMVLVQKKYLESRGGMSASMPTSMKRSMRDPSSVDPDPFPLPSGGRSSGGSSQSGQSWEVVNGSSPLHSDPRQQQQQRSVMAGSGTVPVENGLSSKGRLAGTVPVENGLGSKGRLLAGNEDRGETGAAGALPKSPAGLGLAPGTPRSKTDIIQRRRSDDDVTQPKSKTELIRSSTGAPAEPSRLAEWMGNHYQRQEAGTGASTSQPVVMNGQLGGLVPGSAGIMNPQLLKPQQTGIQYPPFPSPSPQPSPQVSGSYENVTSVGGVGASQNTAASTTSMHIVNQSGLAGGRVIRNQSDSFGSGPANTLTLQSQQLAMTNIPITRDGGGARGSPQEHADLTATTPTNAQTNNSPRNLDREPSAARIHFDNLPMGGLSDSLDRRCPVCVQDFSHMSMDDFQSHVFECFDNSEESMAPETLQPAPEQVSGRQQPSPPARACPMCQREFGNDITQQFFEGHVQSHFEDVTDHFEVLEAHRS